MVADDLSIHETRDSRSDLNIGGILLKTAHFESKLKRLFISNTKLNRRVGLPAFASYPVQLKVSLG